MLLGITVGVLVALSFSGRKTVKGAVPGRATGGTR
jgi:hypothetical protein